MYDMAGWKQPITIYTLPNISRQKDNQTMKLSKQIEQNMRNIILENSSTKFGGKSSATSFYKMLKLRIFLDQLSEML